LEIDELNACRLYFPKTTEKANCYFCLLLLTLFFVQDDFNLTGLNGLVPYYDYALDMVLDVEMPMEDTLTEVRTWMDALASVKTKLL
jgi:hypothetical protein